MCDEIFRDYNVSEISRPKFYIWCSTSQMSLGMIILILWDKWTDTKACTSTYSQRPYSDDVTARPTESCLKQFQ